MKSIYIQKLALLVVIPRYCFANLIYIFSHLFPPQFNLLLLEISPFLFVDQHKIYEISALETVVYIWICWRQISARKIKSNRDAFTFDGGSVHYFKLIEIFSLCHRVLTATDDLLSYYTELHMLNFDPNQIEKDLAQDAILEMIFVLAKFEFNVEAFLDAHLHLDWPIGVRLLSDVGDKELFFLGYPIVVPVDYYINVVS